MKILVHYPSRERSMKLLERIREYQSLSDDKETEYLISLDNNDFSITAGILEALQELNCTVVLGDSKNKIEACNRDIEKAKPWDILVLASDDMVCVQKGWDTILKYEMGSNFYDTDGVLWHWDGDPNTRHRLNTMCILGRAYYDRFNYIYHPEYSSLWADNEFTEVSKLLNKVFYSDDVLFKHVHFSNTPGLMPDALMNRTQSYYRQDEAVFIKHKAENYGILSRE